MSDIAESVGKKANTCRFKIDLATCMCIELYIAI